MLLQLKERPPEVIGDPPSIVAVLKNANVTDEMVIFQKGEKKDKGVKFPVRGMNAAFAATVGLSQAEVDDDVILRDLNHWIDVRKTMLTPTGQPREEIALTLAGKPFSVFLQVVDPGK